MFPGRMHEGNQKYAGEKGTVIFEELMGMSFAGRK
jgi:hypothetical protein